jgi:hypothetical protein
MTSYATLTPLYEPWLRAVTGGPIPAETKATCSSCAMAPSEGSPAEATYFHPDLKCCVYQPHLPNFLAGRLLSDLDSSITNGREELERRIARKVGVSPRWAGPGNLFGLIYQNVPNVFGRAPALRCHFLSSTGTCGIWKHRPGVCVTWHCKYVRGETGSRFWKLADKLLQTVEHELSLWCLAELNPGLTSIDEAIRSTAPDVTELGAEIDPALYGRLWGDWVGREIEFYQACARLVDRLTWEEIQSFCGPRVRILAELVRDAYSHLLSQAIPERLRLGKLNFTNVEEQGFRVVSYNPYDPLLMPQKLVRVLHYFDGRLTEDALNAILSKEAIRLDIGLVRRMVDFGVLQSCDIEDKALPVLR